MKLLIFLRSIAIALFLSEISQASTANLLVCPATGSLFYSNCRVDTVILAKKPHWDTADDEAIFSINYDFKSAPGTGPTTTNIVLISGTSNSPIRFDQVGTATVTGTGDFYLGDATPSTTSSLWFTKSSHLLLTSEPTVRPSDAQMAKWTGEIAIKRNQLSEYSSAKDGYDKLLEYYGAYYFIKGLAASLDEKLTNDQMIKLRQDADANSALIDSLLRNSKDLKLSGEQVVGLANLKVALGSLDKASDWINPDGSTKSLADHMSPEEVKILKDLGETVSDSQKTEYEANQEKFATLVAVTQARIEKLEAMIGDLK